MSTNEKIREALRRVPFLSSLTDAQCDALAPIVRAQNVAEGRVLFREGDPGDSMVIVATGRLSVRVSTRPGIPAAEVASIYPGEVVGEMACVDPAPRSASVVAAKDSAVLELSRTTLQAVIQHAPSVAVAVIGGVISHLTRRVRETNERIEQEMLRRGLKAESLARAKGVEARRPESRAAPKGRIDLKSVPCLQSFSNVQLQQLVKVAPPQSYRPGTDLCREGDMGASCFIIAAGRVEILRRISGRERTLATLPSGSVVGQMALVDRAPRSATVRVSEPAVALELQRKVFEQLLSAADPIAVRFQEQIAIAGIKQLRMANERLASLIARPIEQPRPPESQQAPAAKRPVRRPVASDGDHDVEVLAFMQTALEEWDLSLGDLDSVEVRRVEGQMSPAEIKARERR